MYFVQRTALPRLGQEEAESWSWPGLELVTGHESQNTTESEPSSKLQTFGGDLNS